MAERIQLYDTEFENEDGSKGGVVGLYTVDAKEAIRISPHRYKPASAEDREVLERKAEKPTEADLAASESAVVGTSVPDLPPAPPEGRAVRGGPRPAA
jgi:hypothetical protein